MQSEPKFNLKPGLIASGITIVLMLILSAWAWVQIPAGQKIPVHWNLAGQVDRYGGKAEGLLGMPLVVLFLVGLFAVITQIEPRKMHLRKSVKAYTAIWITGLIMLLALHVFGVLSTLGQKMDVSSVMPALIGLTFVGIGNYLPKLRSNFFAGCRTPWTLSSELSWSKTHRLGGKLCMLYGLAVIVGGLLLGNNAAYLLIIVGGLAVVVFVVMYSYVIWKSDPNKILADGEVASGSGGGTKKAIIAIALASVALAAVVLYVEMRMQPPSHVIPPPSPAKSSPTQLAYGMIDSMARGDFASATRDFDAPMKAAMSVERLSQVWSQLTAQAGAFKSRDGSREAQEAGSHSVYVTCRFEKANWVIKVVVSRSGRVSGLWLLAA